MKTKLVKEIKVDLDKCIGCRACEVACSGFHASPQYSSINPARSRIRVVMDMLNDVYVPLRASDYSPAECAGRNSFKIHGKEYSECSFCNVSCPARDLFREPDSGLPLKCDMCESDPTLKVPMCVEVCRCEALTYVEKEVAVVFEQEEKRDEIGLGLESLVNRFGVDRVFEEMRRFSKS
jgi:benzoyl-CoA reductase subunit BamC